MPWEVSLGFQEAEVKDPVRHATWKAQKAQSFHRAWMVIKKILQCALLFKINGPFSVQLITSSDLWGHCSPLWLQFWYR